VLARSALAAVAIALLLAPATQAVQVPRATVRSYRVVSAAGSITVQFHGDGSPACQLAGRCGYSGTLVYTFALDPAGDEPGEAIVFTVAHQPSGLAGSFPAAARLDASISHETDPAPCLDSVTRDSDYFDVDVRGRTASFAFPPEAPAGETLQDDHFATRCTGPTQSDIAGPTGILTGTFPARTLERRVIRLDASTNREFTASGFSGTVAGSAHILLRLDKRIDLGSSGGGVSLGTSTPEITRR
jgi:hypothetical protein